jgi:hypothetical protein
VRPTEDVVAEIRGMRAPGYGLPGHAAVGTWRGHGYKDFVAVYWKQRRGIVITMKDFPFEQVIVSTGTAITLPQRISPAL